MKNVFNNKERECEERQIVIFFVQEITSKNCDLQYADIYLSSLWRETKGFFVVKILCPCRITVNTPDFQSGNEGSIPFMDTKYVLFL